MVFLPPSWLQPVASDLSRIGTVGEFVLRDRPNAPLEDTVLISSDSSASKSTKQLADDVEALAAGLGHDLGWSPNEPVQGGKVIAILSENTVRYSTQVIGSKINVIFRLII